MPGRVFRDGRSIRRPLSARFALASCALLLCTPVSAQEYGQPDRDAPGDAEIQAFLSREAERIHREFLSDEASRAELRDPDAQRAKLMHMLGVADVARDEPLHVTVTGRQVRDGAIIENLHFQSLPSLYVTANLYRPEHAEEGERLPAVLYVCGHSFRPRNGNKTAYQSHGLWLARHGYVCLMLDTLQLGEIAGIHHGTYREGRWWWHSAGYTPAGIECLNGMRGIDLLSARADVDPDRIGVTGISGGGAASFWIAAADPRVACAAPVSGMADLPSYVGNRVINGHCDCMFLYNTERWPWARIAALIAPRPLLFVNSDADAIFPMDANDRVIQRLERVYSLFGASDRVDALVSIGGHAYREDIRKGVFRFLNTWLKGDPREVTDSEVDLVEGRGAEAMHPLPPESLRAFPLDTDLPTDELNTSIDRVLASRFSHALPEAGDFAAWRDRIVAGVRSGPLGAHPAGIPAAEVLEIRGKAIWLGSESGIRFPVETLAVSDGASRDVLLVVVGRDEEESELESWRDTARRAGRAVWICRPRGIGPGRWTRRNPPNHVERSLALLGRTADGDRVRDVVAAVRYLRSRDEIDRVTLAGSAAGGVLAAYATLLDESVSGAHLRGLPGSHLAVDAPALLGVLRVCDIAHALGAIAPRPLTLEAVDATLHETVRTVYARAGAAAKLERLASRDPVDASDATDR